MVGKLCCYPNGTNYVNLKKKLLKKVFCVDTLHSVFSVHAQVHQSISEIFFQWCTIVINFIC